jgi:hypothetical protein
VVVVVVVVVVGLVIMVMVGGDGVTKNIRQCVHAPVSACVLAVDVQ